MRAAAAAASDPRAGAVLTKAVLRAAGLLDLTDAQLARIVGVSPASLSRLRQRRLIDPASKEGELAVLFVRLFRSLDGLMSGEQDAVRAWFHAPNHHLGGVPAELVRSIQGLVHVLEYLDAMRAKN